MSCRRQAVDFQDVAQGSRDRLIDEHGFVRREHRPHLLQMGAPIHTLQQDDIDLLAKRSDGIDQLDPILLLQLEGVLFHPVGTFRQVGTASFESDNHPPTGHMMFVRRIIENLGESCYMGGITPNDANSQLRALNRGGPEDHGQEKNADGWFDDGRHGSLAGKLKAEAEIARRISFPFDARGNFWQSRAKR